MQLTCSDHAVLHSTQARKCLNAYKDQVPGDRPHILHSVLAMTESGQMAGQEATKVCTCRMSPGEKVQKARITVQYVFGPARATALALRRKVIPLWLWSRGFYPTWHLKVEGFRGTFTIFFYGMIVTKPNYLFYVFLKKR